MAASTYKGYELQVTGSNSGTWGSTNNTDVITIIDNNLGAITSKALSSSNVTLSATESQSAILRLTGTLTANVQVTTACAGFFFVENLTTGSFTVTITNGVSGVTAPQSTRVTMIADATNGVRIAANVGLLPANNFSDIGSAATAFAAIKQAASESATGVVELATTAEVVTGTDTTRAVTAAGVEAHVDAKAATQAQMETGTAADVYSSPGRQKYNPLHPKAWGYVTFSGASVTLAAGSGITSATWTATGKFDVVLATAMSSASYAVITSMTSAGTGGSIQYTCGDYSKTTSGFSVQVNSSGTATNNGTGVNIIVMGDHA